MSDSESSNTTAASAAPSMEQMVNRFLSWKLPQSVRPDECVLDQNYPRRSGTNLLTADEARQMLEHVLQVKAAPEDSSGTLTGQRAAVDCPPSVDKG